MGIAGFDHVAITVSDMEATMAFYRKVLGAEVLWEDLWREGKIPVFSLQIGANRINVHDAKAPAEPHAKAPTPGSQDLCFRWEGSLAAARTHLESCGVEVILGPVGRPASDGSMGESLYFRDPDDNLLELLSTTPHEGRNRTMTIRLDGGMMGDLAKVPGRVQELERLGYDGVVSAEIDNDPVLPRFFSGG